MALSQEDRISISKAYVTAPIEQKQIEANKAQVQTSIAEQQKKDDANKKLVDDRTLLINPYQEEIKLKNGVIRTVLTEQMVLDAGDRKIGNYFFPNEQGVALPSVSDGIWKFYSAFFGSYGVGKEKLETYGTAATYEQLSLTNINGFITTIESYSSIIRTTGLSCTSAVNPTPPPATLDTIAPDVAVQAAMSSLLTEVGTLQTILTNTVTALNALLVVEKDAARLAARTTELNSVNAALVAITTWLAYPTFNTAMSPYPVDCLAFNAYNASTLAPTKGYSTQLSAFKSALTTRSSQVTTRIGETTGYLGSVVQSPSNGDITGGSGFYLDRAKALNLRIHTMGGSLTTLKGTQRGVGALDQLSKSKQDSVDVYKFVIVASILKAPANGTNKLHIKDVTGLAVGDSIFIISETQPEIPLTIQAISGSMITVDKSISQTYRETELARVYKVL